MRTRTLVLLAVLGLSAARADVAEEDGKRLLGRWVAVASFGADGKATKLSDDDPRRFVMEFTKDKVVTRLKKRSLEGTWKLDTSGTPRAIDIIRLQGGEKRLFKGIYALDGKRLRLCVAGTGNDRPTQFKHGKGVEFATELQRLEE